MQVGRLEEDGACPANMSTADEYIWPSTPKFHKATWPFIKSDMEPSDRINKLRDTTWVISQNRHATIGYLTATCDMRKQVTWEIEFS